MKYLIVCLFLSSSALANEASDIKNLMSSYLKAINHTSEVELKKITSEKYFNKLKDKKILKVTFEKNKKMPKKDKFAFDMTYKKTAKPNFYFVNIKDPSADHYNDYWYLVKFDKGKYLIDDMKFIED